MEEKEDKRQSNILVNCVMLGFFILITAIWLGSYYFIRIKYGVPDNAGTAGDMFGAVGALFSGWAFVGIIWAISIQQKDIKLSLDEMKQAREAHQESADTLKKQALIAQIQVRVDSLKVLIDSTFQLKNSDMKTHDITNHLVSLLTDNLKEINLIHIYLKENSMPEFKKQNK